MLKNIYYCCMGLFTVNELLSLLSERLHHRTAKVPSLQSPAGGIQLRQEQSVPLWGAHAASCACHLLQGTSYYWTIEIQVTQIIIQNSFSWLHHNTFAKIFVTHCSSVMKILKHFNFFYVLYNIVSCIIM